MEQRLFANADHVAIITGGGRGIGRATAIRLAEAGARVAVISRTSAEIDETVALISAAGGEAFAVAGDVADEGFIERAFAAITARYATPTILVNNAGTVANAPVAELSVADFDRVIHTNVYGTFLCSRAFFRAGQPGSIVNLSSLGGISGTAKFPGMSAYVAAKFAVVGLTEALAVEGRPLGIRVNCVAPGAVDTAMLKAAAPFLRTETTPAHVAEIIYFLCNAAMSGAMTGATLPIHSNID